MVVSCKAKINLSGGVCPCQANFKVISYHESVVACAGVGFALAMNRGRLDAGAMIFHVELTLGPPLFGMINHAEL